jgi:hypothetical protein
MTHALALLTLLVLPQERQDKEIIQKCGAAARASMVAVEIHFRKKTRLEKLEMEFDEIDQEQQQIQQLAESQQSLDVWGVAIDADTLLVPDYAIRSKDVEKIVATGADGKSFEVALHALGRNFDGALLKAKEKVALTPVTFEKFEPFELGTNFYIVHAERVDRQWHLNVSPYIVTNLPLLDAKTWMLIDRMRAGSLLFDAKGRCVGVPLDQYLWTLEDGRNSFVGTSILADERVSFDDLERRFKELQKAVAPSLVKVEIMLRQDRNPEYYDPDAQSARVPLFGLPLDERGTLLVPQEFTREIVNKIEELRVVDKGKILPCTFLGSFKDFGAILVRVDGLATKPLHRLDLAALDPGALFFTLTVEERFGRSFAKVGTNRVFRVEKGEKGEWHVATRRPVKAGAWILDWEGRPVGFYSGSKKEEDLESAGMDEERRRYDRYRNGADFAKRIFLFSELKAALGEPSAHFDPRAVPMTKKEEKTLVWLGVEFQELEKKLAESLGIEEKDLTNEGKRGLLITDVYAGSPAEKMGLKADDVLLTITPEGGAATDLTPEADRFDRYRFRGDTFVPWRPRKNYLTQLLTTLGPGRKVSFEFLRGRERKTADVLLEKSPVDFDTAEKLKDDPLGFTVKDLTYEVRYFQKLDPAAGGVVVAKIERGSKAEVAKLQPLAIITRVNGTPLNGLEHFTGLLAGARTSGAKTVTFTVQNFGQTRLVDLELK